MYTDNGALSKMRVPGADGVHLVLRCQQLAQQNSDVDLSRTSGSKFFSYSPPPFSPEKAEQGKNYCLFKDAAETIKLN
jgi:hypothetical protein